MIPDDPPPAVLISRRLGQYEPADEAGFSLPDDAPLPAPETHVCLGLGQYGPAPEVAQPETTPIAAAGDVPAVAAPIPTEPAQPSESQETP